MQQLDIRIDCVLPPSKYAFHVPIEPGRRLRRGEVVIVERHRINGSQTEMRTAEVAGDRVSLIAEGRELSDPSTITYDHGREPQWLRVTGICIGFYQRVEAVERVAA